MKRKLKERYLNAEPNPSVEGAVIFYDQDRSIVGGANGLHHANKAIEHFDSKGYDTATATRAIARIYGGK